MIRTQENTLPLPIIQSKYKNTLREKQKTAIWQRTGNSTFISKQKTASLQTTESCWQKKPFILIFCVITAADLSLSLCMTSYCPSHHDSRSFNHAPDDDFPSAVILNGGKNTLWEKRETEWWNRVKNLLLEWHLTAFLTTIIDPSLPLWMTSYCFPQHISRSFATASDDVLPPLSPRQQIL